MVHHPGTDDGLGEGGYAFFLHPADGGPPAPLGSEAVEGMTRAKTVFRPGDRLPADPPPPAALPSIVQLDTGGGAAPS